MQKKTIENAIIWAAVMLAVALLTPDTEKGQILMLLLMVAGWFATQSLIAGHKDIRAAECAMFRRVFKQPASK